MDELIAELSTIISYLSLGNLEELGQQGFGGNLSKSEIACAMAEYPGTITSASVDESRINFIEYAGSTSCGMLEYELEIDHKISDLTLSCDYNLDRKPKLKIENIHVL